MLNTVLSLAKYKAPLIGILNTLLKEDGLTQSEIGKRIKVSQGEARLYISELERLDLLNRIEDGYYIGDKVFKMWLDLRKTGEIGDSPKDKPMGIYLKILERKYLRAKTELGTAKEYEVREKLREKLGIKFKPYLEKDIEFDGVGIDDTSVNILEVKWKKAISPWYLNVLLFPRPTRPSLSRNIQNLTNFIRFSSISPLR